MNSKERASILPKVGIPYEYLPPERVAEIEPEVNPNGLFGATYASFQGQVNPFLLMWGFLKNAHRQGLSLLTYHEVKNFLMEGSRVVGVDTTKGMLYADKVVLATAAWTRKLGLLIGQNWNIHTFRASAMVTERFSDLHIHSIVTSADHIEAEVNGPEDAELTVMALSQTQEGNFLIAQADRPGEVLDGKISHVAPRTNVNNHNPFLSNFKKSKNHSYLDGSHHLYR